ncbi:nitrous oxide-stimulated promoter family protein [Paenibacillus tuaregi]|uniref:nitrous oxide-stimulated promoter family protein n=1 Tax=Paenibacillus tuaregi TaxID=1816681 RepID=UPI000B1FE1D6|nr:nitrous oxide-stimulated promoter family protein [Paenibacillus tuaregi]
MDNNQGAMEPHARTWEETVRKVQVRKVENQGPRIKREKLTVSFMIGQYCSGHHAREERKHAASNDKQVIKLCWDCYCLHQYAMKRLGLCQFGEEKTTCVECPVHCYKPAMRSQIKEVMKYSGPRMLLSHPVLTVWHLLDQKGDKRTPSS